MNINEAERLAAITRSRRKFRTKAEEQAVALLCEIERLRGVEQAGVVRCKDCIHFNGLSCGRADSADGRRHDPKSLAAAKDYEGYSAWLKVSPEFGCVQGEAAEAAGGAPRAC